MCVCGGGGGGGGAHESIKKTWPKQSAHVQVPSSFKQAGNQNNQKRVIKIL